MSTSTHFSADSFPAAAVPPATFTLQEYEHMVRCGAFAGEHEKNIELVWGRISDRPPVGPEHSNDVDELNEWSVRVTVNEPIRVRIQNPIRMPGSESSPQPDVCWVRKGDYSKGHPGPEDILLVIEIADTSVERDRGTKLAAYAHAGIQDHWIVNLVENQVEIYRQPQGLEYAERRIIKGAETVSPLAVPTVSVTADQLLAKPSD